MYIAGDLLCYKLVFSDGKRLVSQLVDI